MSQLNLYNLIFEYSHGWHRRGISIKNFTDVSFHILAKLTMGIPETKYSGNFEGNPG